MPKSDFSYFERNGNGRISVRHQQRYDSMSLWSWNGIIRCEIWKHFLFIRDSLINKNLNNTPFKNKKKSGEPKSKKPKTDGTTLCDKKTKVIRSERISNIDDTKCSSYSEKMTVEMKSNKDTKIERHMMVINKPWFSPSFFS